MDMDRVRQEAQAIADSALENVDYSSIYEDDDVQDMTEEEWLEIHRLVTYSTALLPKER